MESPHGRNFWAQGVLRRGGAARRARGRTVNDRTFWRFLALPSLTMSLALACSSERALLPEGDRSDTSDTSSMDAEAIDVEVSDAEVLDAEVL
jgi:hypothetical protein